MDIPEGWSVDPGLSNEDTAFLYPAWWNDIFDGWPSTRGFQAKTYDQYYNLFKLFEEKGLIAYEDLGNAPGQKRVMHKNCPRTAHSFCSYQDDIIDEGPWGAFCWGCVRQVDPKAMQKIRAAGKPIETPGPSCWWVLDLERTNRD